MENAPGAAREARHFNKDSRDDVHAKLKLLSVTQAALDVEIGEWLIAAQKLKLHETWACESFEAYTHKMFGWDGRTVRDRIRVARKLESLVLLRDELLDGRMVWSVAREICRIAETPEVEADWIEKTREKSAREVGEMVRGLPPNARPGSKKDPTIETHRRVFDLTSEGLAVLDDFLRESRSRSGESMDDGAALVNGIRTLLNELHAKGNGDAGVSRNQIAYVKRVGSEEMYVTTSDGARLVRPEVAERVECDATTIPPTENGEVVANAAQSIPPSHRRQVALEALGMCEIPSCRHCFDELHHTRFRKDGGTHEVKFLLAVCWGHHQRIHDGFLRVEGDREAGFRFFQANGKRYGSLAGSPSTLAAIADAVQGFNRLGCKDPDARRYAEEAAAELAAEGKPITGEAVFERGLRLRGRVYKISKMAPAPIAPAVSAVAHVSHETSASSALTIATATSPVARASHSEQENSAAARAHGGHTGKASSASAPPDARAHGGHPGKASSASAPPDARAHGGHPGKGSSASAPPDARAHGGHTGKASSASAPPDARAHGSHPGKTDSASALPESAMAHASHLVELESEAISALRNLRFNEREARERVAIALASLRVTNAPPTVERVITEALRSRGQSMMAREGSGGGGSRTGTAEVPYRVRPFRPAPGGARRRPFPCPNALEAFERGGTAKATRLVNTRK